MVTVGTANAVAKISVERNIGIVTAQRRSADTLFICGSPLVVCRGVVSPVSPEQSSPSLRAVYGVPRTSLLHRAALNREPLQVRLLAGSLPAMAVVDAGMQNTSLLVMPFSSSLPLPAACPLQAPSYPKEYYQADYQPNRQRHCS
jgi:hypothetical protein